MFPDVLYLKTYVYRKSILRHSIFEQSMTFDQKCLQTMSVYRHGMSPDEAHLETYC